MPTSVVHQIWVHVRATCSKPQGQNMAIKGNTTCLRRLRAGACTSLGSLLAPPLGPWLLEPPASPALHGSSHLCRVVKHPLLPRLLLVGHHGLGDQAPQGGAHARQHSVQPNLDLEGHVQQTLSVQFLTCVQSGCTTPWQRASSSLLLCAASFSLHVVTSCVKDPGTWPRRGILWRMG